MLLLTICRRTALESDSVTMALKLPASTGEALLTGEAGDSACVVAYPLLATPAILKRFKANNAWLACRCVASGKAETSGTQFLKAASQPDLHCLLIADMPVVEGAAELNAMQDKDVCMLPIPCNSPAVAAAFAHRRRHALHQLQSPCQKALGAAEAAQGTHSASTLLADEEPQDMQVSPFHLVGLNAAGELCKLNS